MRIDPMLCKGLVAALLLFIASNPLVMAQAGGDALPLNQLDPDVLASIEVNGVSFSQLQESEGDEGEIAALCECSYTVLKSEDPGMPWVAYTLFEGEYRLALSFGELENGRLGITHLDLLGVKANVTLKGVTLARGDTVAKLGSFKSHRQYNGGSLHFALFPGISAHTFFHIDFEPESGIIRKIGYIAPF